MATNTFLDTSRTTGIATSNPQTNINKVNNQQMPQNQSQQPQQTQKIPFQQTTPQQQSNQVATIPLNIQLQPQIAPQTQQNNEQQQAPTPQKYNAPQNTNVVDFNKIYSQYNQAVGNQATNIGSSGIKKTSLGTTIVTPTANPDTPKGMYQSNYSDSINSLISNMLTQINKGFEYDPANDEALKLATEYAANSTLQSLAGSGVLNSSATSERVARIVSELIPQYEEKAHDRWIEYLGQLSDTAQIVMNYDSQQFEYWKAAKDEEYKNKQFEYQKQQDELENAWKRVDELGYVDNKASTILGVPVGTLSGSARLAKEQREFELQKMREQAEIEYANNKALYELRAELDKDLYRTQAELDKKATEYKYQLEQKYNSEKNNTKNKTSLSTYQDIINNRWAEYDDFTKKYTISDNTSLYNYLVTEYSAGRMSSSDLANLTAMYNVTKPTSEDFEKQERIKYLNTLESV